jgi:hypothetical protein
MKMKIRRRQVPGCRKISDAYVVLLLVERGGEGPGGGVLDSVLVPQPHQDPPQRRDDRARWSNERKNYIKNWR